MGDKFRSGKEGAGLMAAGVKWMLCGKGHWPGVPDGLGRK